MTVDDAAGPPASRRADGARGRTRRARLDPETRRAQLIDAAAAQLDERGLTALGVDEVADAAGVSRSLVYAYFGDRDGLAAEVYVRILRRLDEHLTIELPPAEAGIRQVVSECMTFAQANRAAWRLLVSDPSRQHPVVRQARAMRAARISERWHADSAAAPVADSALRADPAPAGTPAPTGALPPTGGPSMGGPGRRGPRQMASSQLAAEAALGLLESGVLHWLDNPDVPADEAVVLLTSLLWSGLTARPAGPG